MGDILQVDQRRSVAAQEPRARFLTERCVNFMKSCLKSFLAGAEEAGAWLEREAAPITEELTLKPEEGLGSLAPS